MRRALALAMLLCTACTTTVLRQGGVVLRGDGAERTLPRAAARER